MALFRSRQHNVFQPTSYGYARRKRRIPRWLVLITTGIVLGAGGLLFIQKSYGPTRLTAEQSRELHESLNSSNMEIQRLESQLEQTRHDLNQTQDRNQTLETELDTISRQNDELKSDILLLASAVAPDPRGTTPGIRGANFANVDDMLDYQVLIMQDDPNADLYKGEMVLIVQGIYPNGRSNTIALDPVPLELGHYTQLSGQLPLPDGLKARQVTIRINDEGTEKRRAMRVINVR